MSINHTYPYRVIVAGCRDFTDQSIGFNHISYVLSRVLPCDIQIICGEARGADTIGKLWAQERNISVVSFPADWNQYGKSAGYIRNSQMAQYATHLIAFWDGHSHGTKHMITLAKKYSLVINIRDISKQNIRIIIMSLLLEHIEANMDDLIDNPNELLYITKEDAEEMGVDFDYSVDEVKEGLAGAAIGAAAGHRIGKSVANVTGLAAGYIAARKLPQYKAWKDAVAKVKALKSKPNHNTSQLAKLQADAKKKRIEFKRKRDQIISHKIIKHGAAAGAVGAAAGGVAGGVGSGLL